MSKKSIISIIIIIIIILVAGYFVVTKFSNDESEMTGPQQVELKIGEPQKVLGIEMEALDVLEDSRCPANANCIQAGTVRARILIVRDGDRTSHIFELGRPVITETEELVLREVEPAQQPEVKIPLADYVFHVDVIPRVAPAN